MNLIQKLQEKSKRLNFKRNTHTYTVNNKVLTPVSNLVKGFVVNVDWEEKARNVARREGKTTQQVLNEWKINGETAAEFGTDVHDFAENFGKWFYYSEGTEPKPSNKHEKAVVKYWKLMPDFYMPIGFEVRSFSEAFGYAGTFDLLCQNTKTRKFIIIDYKTNKDLFKNFKGQLMLPPFHYILDMPYNHYQLQLSLYQILLEEAGYKIESRQIVWLLPDGNFKVYEANDFTKMLKKELKNGRNSWGSN